LSDPFAAPKHTSILRCCLLRCIVSLVITQLLPLFASQRPITMPKFALLIGSPYGDLQGSSVDVERIANFLEKRGNFTITRCCDGDATLHGIRSAWRGLIGKLSKGDTVVIFYSGHGGLVEAPKLPDGDRSRGHGSLRQYQFLVPIDYGKSVEGDFRGLLDVEISHLLRDTTNKTPNVTLILDCCHAGRMARNPIFGDKARVKRLKEVQHADIARVIERLNKQGFLVGETALQGNEDAIRIAAAATEETAWEVRNEEGQWSGVLTDALICALEEAKESQVSWRTTFARVNELVGTTFPQQHPQVEGPETRRHFSLETITSLALTIDMEEDEVVIQGGRVTGVRERNVYNVVPFGSDIDDEKSWIGEATVTDLVGFKARVDWKPRPNVTGIPKEGALAVLWKEALYEWPVGVPKAVPELWSTVQASKFLRPKKAGVDRSSLADFDYDDGVVVLRTSNGVEIASVETDSQQPSAGNFETIVKKAETLAKGQHLLGLGIENRDDLLHHNVQLEVGRVINGEARPISTDGSGILTEGDRVYVSVHNPGPNKVHVQVFSVNISGEVFLLEASTSPLGRMLGPSDSHTFGRNQFKSRLQGISLVWPESVPKSQTIGERLICIVTSAPVDLRHLVTGKPPAAPKDAGSSALEKLTARLSSGIPKQLSDVNQGAHICYDKIEVPYSISRLEIRSSELPELGPDDDADRSNDVPSHLAQRGVYTTLVRTLRKVPAFLWVVNEHDEEITVVVAKYRPNRLLKGVGINASATGGGLNYETAMFVSPATKKVLRPPGDETPAAARFPLWTRSEKYGVITVFCGPDKRLFIENDQVPIGSTVYFRKEPNLRIVAYDGTEISCDTPHHPESL
ncbi:hypothetical protein CI238_10755, partial [Colletotrichum incanum]